jgi:4a-hydroxytetrahydrobiopterin dehydratase
MTVQFTAGQFHAADGVEDWRSLYHLISAHFRTGSLAKGIALVDEIGRLVDADEQQPKWWVLADAEGNEACVATWVGRE